MTKTTKTTKTTKPLTAEEAVATMKQKLAANKKPTVTATKKARKAAPKKAADTVPGHDNVKLVTGKGVTPRTIAAIVSANSGHDEMAILNDGTMHKVTEYHKAGVLCKAGLNFDNVNRTFLAMQRAEAEAAKQTPKLANGVDARTAPHSAKAVSDAKKAATPAEKKTARKAAKAAKAAPKSDNGAKLKHVDKKFSFGGDGTARRASWDAFVKVAKAGGTVADYVAAGGKAKYLPRWKAAGAVSY